MLLSLQELKSLIGASGNSDDLQLAGLLEAAEQFVKSYTGREPESANYVEYHSGDGTPLLALRQRPVTAVEEVRVDPSGSFGADPSAFGPSTLLTYGVDYCVDWDQSGQTSRSGLLVRLNGVWRTPSRLRQPSALSADVGSTFGNVKVSYTAGFPAGQLPADLRVALATLVRFGLRMVKAGQPLAEERIGDYSYAVSSALLAAPELGSVRSTLANYRESGW
jgi:hypothetical protein